MSMVDSLLIRWSFHDNVVWWMCYPRFLGGRKKTKSVRRAQSEAGGSNAKPSSGRIGKEPNADCSTVPMVRKRKRKA